MSKKRGAIHCMESYLRAKTLDHSGWDGKLPRNITPSDIDAAIDDNGRILFIELSFVAHTWDDPRIPDGQRRLYARLAELGRGAVTCIIALCDTPVGRPTDTVEDVTHWTVTRFDPETNDLISKVYGPPDNWLWFVSHWWVYDGWEFPPSKFLEK